MRVTVVLCLQLWIHSAYGQVLNGGFEDWSGPAPAHWHVGSHAYRDTNSRSGMYCFGWGSNPTWEPILDNMVSDSLNYFSGGWRIPHGTYSYSFWYNIQTSNNSTVVVSHGPVVSHSGKRASALYAVPLFGTTRWNKVIGTIYEYTDSTKNDSLGVLFTGYDGSRDTKPFTLLLDDFEFDTITSSVARTTASRIVVSIQPNPVFSHANVRYRIDGHAIIRADVFDLTGRLVSSLPDVRDESLTGSIPFDCDALPTGTYFLHFDGGGRVVTLPFSVLH